MISEETKLVQRIDATLLKIAGAPLHNVTDCLCAACRQKKKHGVSDNAGHTLCLDCYPSPKYMSFGNLPTKVPQGDDLVRLPRERFTKKFT